MRYIYEPNKNYWNPQKPNPWSDSGRAYKKHMQDIKKVATEEQLLNAVKAFFDKTIAKLFSDVNGKYYWEVMTMINHCIKNTPWDGTVIRTWGQYKILEENAVVASMFDLRPLWDNLSFKMSNGTEMPIYWKKHYDQIVNHYNLPNAKMREYKDELIYSYIGESWPIWKTLMFYTLTQNYKYNYRFFDYDDVALKENADRLGKDILPLTGPVFQESYDFISTLANNNTFGAIHPEIKDDVINGYAAQTPFFIDNFNVNMMILKHNDFNLFSIDWRELTHFPMTQIKPDPALLLQIEIRKIFISSFVTQLKLHLKEQFLDIKRERANEVEKRFKDAIMAVVKKKREMTMEK